MRLFRTGGLVTVLLAAVVACNQLFDINEGNLVEMDGGSSNEQDGASPSGDSGNDAVADSGADTGSPETWLFAGSQGATSEVVVVRPTGQSATIVGQFTLPTNDALVYASGGRAFVLNRSTGDIFALDRNAPLDTARIANYSGAKNPYAVEVVGNDVAYVIQYGANEVLVADLRDVDNQPSFKVTGSIDLSPFAAGDDSTLDPAGSVFVPSENRVYIILQRIKSGFPPTCSSGGSIVVAIDTTKNAIADFTNDTVGNASDKIPLVGGNPAKIIYDQVGARLLVAHYGCTGLADAGLSGVDEIPLATHVAKNLVQPPEAINDLLYVNASTAFVYDQTWRKWDPRTSSVGAIAPIPQAPLVVPSAVVGLSGKAADGGTSWELVRTDASGSLQTTVLPGQSIFKNVTPTNVFFVSSARL